MTVLELPPAQPEDRNVGILLAGNADLPLAMTSLGKALGESTEGKEISTEVT